MLGEDADFVGCLGGGKCSIGTLQLAGEGGFLQKVSLPQHVEKPIDARCVGAYRRAWDSARNVLFSAVARRYPI